ncbi:MAG TPA: acylphosphatase [Thermoleophilaceae bacterium]|nr:acylphosphatase [Thermoleophilaceae bacterium]
MSEPIRRRVLVHGHVQGVFFRDTVRGEARARGVAGWVSNRLDGSVEAVFEGPPAAVEAMVAVTRRGPRGAVVEEVEVSEERPEGLSGFEVS